MRNVLICYCESSKSLEGDCGMDKVPRCCHFKKVSRQNPPSDVSSPAQHADGTVAP